jgi:hypothetical protein
LGGALKSDVKMTESPDAVTASDCGGGAVPPVMYENVRLAGCTCSTMPVSATTVSVTATVAGALEPEVTATVPV